MNCAILSIERCVAEIETWMTCNKLKTIRLYKRSLRLPTRRKWAQSRYLGTTAQAGADADISWS